MASGLAPYIERKIHKSTLKSAVGIKYPNHSKTVFQANKAQNIFLATWVSHNQNSPSGQNHEANLVPECVTTHNNA